MNDLESHYQTLGLEPTATPGEIKEAYRDLTKVWHPDRFTHDPRLQQKAQEKLKEINRAYERIKNKTSDKGKGASQSEPQKEEPPPPTASPQSSEHKNAQHKPKHNSYFPDLTLHYRMIAVSLGVIGCALTFWFFPRPTIIEKMGLLIAVFK